MDAAWLAVVAVGALVFLAWKMGSYCDAARNYNAMQRYLGESFFSSFSACDPNRATVRV
jgi:hypothetical protein